MTTIKASVTRMFEHREPWDCSNSVANLGDNAGKLTWDCALEVAANAANWLHSDRAEACEGMRAWAKDTGAWDDTEIATWSEDECLALLVQNVASDLRECLDSDSQELTECVKLYESTDWDKESAYPTGCYYLGTESVMVDYYTGC